jgi:hypothetical protein
LRLHEVEHIVGGMLFLPAKPEVIVSLVEEIVGAPDELSAMVNVMKAHRCRSSLRNTMVDHW